MILTQINAATLYLSLNIKKTVMKKLLVLAALCVTVYAVNAQPPQGGGDPAAMMARMKERIKPQLMEKAKLSDAEADKVIEINFDSRRQMRDIRMDQSLSDDDKKKKIDELRTGLDKKYKEIPLTDDQVKAVNDFYEEMRKNREQRSNWNGGGNGNG